MNIHQSAEDYLEAILKLKETSQHVRSIDIVQLLGFSKPSVSIAMKNLKENGYITVDQNGYLDLTEEGFKIANKTYQKEKLLTEALTLVGVSQEQAEIDACKIEHVLSDESFNALYKYVKEHKD